MVYEAEIGQSILIVGICVGALCCLTLIMSLAIIFDEYKKKKELKLLSRESAEFVRDYIHFKAQQQEKQIL